MSKNQINKETFEDLLSRLNDKEIVVDSEYIKSIKEKFEKCNFTIEDQIKILSYSTVETSKQIGEVLKKLNK